MAKWREVYEVIRSAGREVSLQEIRALTNMNYNTLRGSVVKLTRAGLVERVRKGVYRARQASQ